jgi:hypothetical protein
MMGVAFVSVHYVENMQKLMIQNFKISIRPASEMSKENFCKLCKRSKRNVSFMHRYNTVDLLLTV